MTQSQGRLLVVGASNERPKAPLTMRREASEAGFVSHETVDIDKQKRSSSVLLVRLRYERLLRGRAGVIVLESRCDGRIRSRRRGCRLL